MCFVSPIFYLLAFGSQLWKLDEIGRTLDFLRGALTYADDVSIEVSEGRQSPRWENVIRRYEPMAGAKFNLDKPEWLQHGTWRGKLIPSIYIVWS